MNRKFEVITAISVIIIIGGALVFAYKNGTLNDEKSNLKGNKMVRKIFTIDGDKVGDKVDLSIDSSNSTLEVVKTDDTELKVEVICDKESNYQFQQRGTKVIVKKHNERVISLFRKDNKSKIKVYMPKNIISSYDVDISNGSVSMSNIVVSDVEIDTSNGNINLKNLSGDGNIEVDTSNAGMEVDDVVCNYISLDSSNGSAHVSNVKAKEKISIDTSNGAIIAKECYAEKVILETSNGSIALENIEDKEFVIDELEVDTSNASEDINAKYNHRRW